MKKSYIILFVVTIIAFFCIIMSFMKIQRNNHSDAKFGESSADFSDAQSVENQANGNETINPESESADAGEKITKARINFVIDDGYSDLTEIKAIFDKYNMKAGIAVITDYIGSSDDYITEDQLLEFYQDGWEVLSHSKTHKANWSELSEEDIKIECQDSKQYLESIGIDVRGIAIPYIFLPEEYKNIVTQSYDYCLGSMGGEDDLTDKIYPRAHLTATEDKEASVNEIKEQMDLLMNMKGERSYFFHYTHPIGQYLVSPDMSIDVLDSTLKYISEHPDEIEVVLPKDMYCK